MELDGRQLSSIEKVENYLNITKRNDYTEDTDPGIAEENSSSIDMTDVDSEQNSQRQFKPTETTVVGTTPSTKGDQVSKNLQATPTLQKLQGLVISSSSKNSAAPQDFVLTGTNSNK